MQQHVPSFAIFESPEHMETTQATLDSQSEDSVAFAFINGKTFFRTGIHTALATYMIISHKEWLMANNLLDISSNEYLDFISDLETYKRFSLDNIWSKSGAIFHLAAELMQTLQSNDKTPTGRAWTSHNAISFWNQAWNNPLNFTPTMVATMSSIISDISPDSDPRQWLADNWHSSVLSMPVSIASLNKPTPNHKDRSLRYAAPSSD